jgi:NIMA (never in mitosis gene a)-related kinase
MCKAVKHIHEGNIIHRDLKPGNIFLIDDYIIKIGDFGLALNSKSNQNKQGGTYLYQSPEQINNKPYDEKVDIFALGVILVELVSKFNTEFERSEILQGLKKSIYPEYLKDGHLKEYNLVKKMTTLDPKERPNIKDIFKDNDFIDLINESLNTD